MLSANHVFLAAREADATGHQPDEAKMFYSLVGSCNGASTRTKNWNLAYHGRGEGT